MNQSIEKTALSNLITNEDYARKVIPFLKGDYFKVREERIVFEEIQKFIDKYKKIPTKTTLNIEIENRKDLNQDDHDKIVKLISSLDATDVDIEWLLETTEKFCKDKAIYNAIVEGVEIIDGNTSSYANYSYCEPWYFTAGTTIGVGKNNGSGTLSGQNMWWGVHLLA